MRLATQTGRGLLLVIVASLMSCVVKSDQRPPDDSPIGFLGTSGSRIDRVLIIPVYVESTGVASRGGHGPGTMSARLYFARAFVYKAGERFPLALPNSTGVSLGETLFAGKGVVLHGCVVLGNGYRPAWLWQLWDRGRLNLSLEPIPAPEAASIAQRWSKLLGLERITADQFSESERFFLGLDTHGQIQTELSEPEKAAAVEFLRVPATSVSGR